MLQVALEIPTLFKDTKVPLLLSLSAPSTTTTTTLTTESTNTNATTTANEASTTGESVTATAPGLLCQSVTLSHRQVACLLAHSAFGSITANARQVRKEKWAFRAAQMFFLEALPSAFCFLNYFKLLGQRGFPTNNPTSLRYERRAFARGHAPFVWENASMPMCVVELAEGAIEASQAGAHVDFANRYA
jgi:hypothetical protein